MIEILVPLSFLIAVGGLIAWLVAISRRIEKKRTEALRTFAASRKLEFAEADTTLLGGAPFKVLSEGRKHRISNIARGVRDGVEVTLCDYYYVTGGGKSSSIHQHSLCLLRTPGHAGPPFYLRRQLAFFDNVGKMLGGQDINFPDDPTFSDAFVLQTTGSEPELRQFMNVNVRQAFSGLKYKWLTVESLGDQLLVDHAQRLKAEELDEFLATALALRATWK